MTIWTSTMRALPPPRPLYESPWTCLGISVNVNGLNSCTKYLFDQLLFTYSVVAFQQTKFSSWDNVFRVNQFIHSVSLKASKFWSYVATSRFSGPLGRDSVGLGFCSGHLFDSLTDVNASLVDSSVLSRHRYLVAVAAMGSFRLLFHLVYAEL